MIYGQGSFFNGANTTPEEIERKRETIRQMMGNYGSANYVGEGVGHMFSGALNGMALRRMKEAEAAGRKTADATESHYASQPMWETPGGSPSPGVGLIGAESRTQNPPAPSPSATERGGLFQFFDSMAPRKKPWQRGA